MKNIDAWGYAKEAIDNYINTYLEQFRKVLAKEMYLVSPNGSITTLTIDRLRYSDPEKNLSYAGKTPTNLEVVQIQHIAGSEWPLEDKFVYVDYHYYFAGKRKAASSINLVKLMTGSNPVFSQEVAESTAKAIKDEKYRQDQLIASGTHFVCAYCQKVAPVESMLSATIWSGGRKGIYEFCSGDCAKHKQMSAEG